MEALDWEKIHATHVSDNEFVCRLRKTFIAQ